MANITRLFGLSTAIAALVLAAISSPSAKAQIRVPQSRPYSSDAHTVLLEHFDDATSGSPNGDVSYTNGIFGKGVSLDDNSWIGWALGSTANGTVEFWGKLDNLTNSIGPSVSNPDFIWAYMSPAYVGQGPGSTLVINVRSTDGPDGHQGMPGGGFHLAPFNALGAGSNSVVIATNTWHHYAMTWGDAGLHFYVDGALVGTNSVGQPWSATSFWTVSNANGLGFNGTLDELRISDIQRVFTNSRLLSIETAAVRLRWFAESNQTYQVQWSPDMQGWSNMTELVGTGGETNLLDWTDGSKRFYRLITP